MGFFPFAVRFRLRQGVFPSSKWKRLARRCQCPGKRLARSPPKRPSEHFTSNNNIPLGGGLLSASSRHQTTLDIKTNFLEEMHFNGKVVCLVCFFPPLLAQPSCFSKESGHWLASVKATHLSPSKQSDATSYRPSRFRGSVAPVGKALKWGCDGFSRTLGNMQPLDQKNHSPAAETRSATQSWRLLLCRLRPFRVKELTVSAAHRAGK